MFGLGYIGYMTFNITLLREQGMASGGITLFYWCWASAWWPRRGCGRACCSAIAAACRWPC